MGRLGPLNSLAFGRSPFQPPELDENGDFILGAHAHDFDNKDFYTQKFDERGHPINNASRATVRAMQHAQNAVLETVGVVVRREEASKSAWQRQSKKEKIADIINENTFGIAMREILPFAMQSLMWWRFCLQNRMQVFRSYLNPPVAHIIRSEAEVMGPLSFLTDGLLASIAGYLLNILLTGMRSRTSEVILPLSIGGTSYAWKPFESFAAELSVSLLVFPVKVFSLLQGLHLIPSIFQLNPSCFVPFTAASPIQLLRPPAVWSVGTGLAFATNICCHPFVLGTISDMTKAYIHDAMYQVILVTLTPKPDCPDKLTIKAARQDGEDEESLSLPGIGYQNNAVRLSRDRTTDFWTEIGRELGFLAARIYGWKIFSIWSSPLKELTETEPQPIPAELADRTRALQRQMVQNQLENLRTNQEERLRVQREAHNRALADFGLYSGTGNFDEWLLPAHELFDPDTHSTATPEPVDLVDHAADQAQDLEQPPLVFNRFTPNNEFDREEREGEGRMMASLGFDEPDEMQVGSVRSPTQEAITEELMSMRPVLFRDLSSELSAPELRNPFETASDPSREAVLEEATRVAPDEVGIRHVLERPDGSVYDEHYPGAGVSTDVLHEPIPEAPDSPLEGNATPPAISQNREGSPSTERRRRAPSPTSTSSEEMSVWSGDFVSIRNPALRRRNARRSLSDMAFHNPPSLSSSDTGAAPLPRTEPPHPSLPDLRLSWPSGSSSGASAAHDPHSGPPHRVTTLSVFPAEMFAECASDLFTSAVTLPLDSLYMRSLALGFLGTPAPGARIAASGIRADVYGLGDWFGGRAGGWRGRLRYAGVMALMMGLQGCLSSLCWAFATRLAILVGRQTGWGQL